MTHDSDLDPQRSGACLIMIVNNTGDIGNVTSTSSASKSSVGLAVGLTLFFLLLVIIAGVMVYKYQSKIRNLLQSGQGRSQRKEDYTETPDADSRHYTTFCRDQSIGQSPIYENLNSRAPQDNRRSVKQSRSPTEPEEDLYLQCEVPDDAIYSNDPAGNVSIHAETTEEDVYVVPDS